MRISGEEPAEAGANENQEEKGDDEERENIVKCQNVSLLARLAPEGAPAMATAQRGAVASPGKRG